jgi:TRAP transporter TAXI family solute receptor
VTDAWRQRLRIYVPIAAIVGTAFFVTYRSLDPTPPSRVRIAAGGAEGMYMEAARRYRDLLARDRVDLEIVPTAGSLENIALLRRAEGGVDLAFVQGGTMPGEAPDLQSLASVFLEPLWVFVRADLPAERIVELQGRRLAVGIEGSGTRALALQLLQASGVNDAGRMRSIGGPESVTALLAGGVDAAFFVTARPLPLLEPLFRSPAVRLMSFAQADAYTRRFRFLSKVTLPDGVIDLATDVPPYDVALLAPAAALVARDSLHHAIVDLVLQAATKVHAPGQLFAEPGQFPSARYLDVPLGDDAQRYFKSGPSFLRRHLPFWVATQVERLSLLLLPLVGLVFPLLGLAPTLFGSGIRRRLTRSYGRLLTLERQVAMVATPEDRARVLERLDQLEADVARLKIPATHAEHLYHLRTHVDFMRRRMLGGAADARPSEPRVERPRRAASA